jgi:hypothetical protein
VGAANYSAHALQIRPETPVGHVVGVTDPIAELRSLATDVTSLRHDALLGVRLSLRTET